ncbi:MAG: ABC transporter transmembrane domain-containing protein [Gammaproteobacteria bacterium]|nr:ABC transporter transmembrane domain-containing protein [Gammaproteobacteria bacterium]MDP2349478.1 ABC transporter transmembrane domain-containing protein [Gammaproteobacteria bacterium]
MTPQPSASAISSLRKAFAFMRPYKMQIALATLALVFTAAVTLALVQFVRVIVDVGFVAGSSQSLGWAIAGFMVVAVIQAMGTFARFYWVSWLGERVTADIRTAVYGYLLTLHPGYFEENLSGEIQSRITTDTTLLQTVIGSSVSVALRNLLMLLGGTVFLFITNPRLTSIVMICIPLVIGPIMIFGRKVRHLSRSSQDEIANVGAYVGESIQHIKTVQAYNHQHTDEKVFSNHVESAFKVALARIRSRSFLITIVITLVFGAVAAMIWVGGQDVINGRMSAGELTAFVVYAVIVASAVGSISQVIGDLQRAAGATERLMELLHAPSNIVSPAEPLSFPEPFRGEIVLEHLRFHYPSRPNTAAIDGLDLHVRPGTSVALVGPSGAGKSTLFDLLLRFYDPQQGKVLVDGLDIRNVDLLALRSHIAIVSQQPTMFTGNVRENIRYGRPDATDEEVMEAAKAAFASDFIEQLPQGYDSYLGESGIRLSGGQKQRLAIARAILKDAEILLLDEATSALDAESERKVQMALDSLMQNRTTIIIAHRLATVMNVDSIVVMDAGKVVAQGSHQQLLATSPLYANLAALQFAANRQNE